MSLLNLLKKNIEAHVAPKKEAAIKKLVGVEDKAGTAKRNIRPEVLRRPHITEKAAAGAERGVYVFEVSTTANKREIAEAVSLFYKVTPIKVTVVTIPAKRIMVKGRPGFRKGGKKAYVYLKKGDKIEVI